MDLAETYENGNENENGNERGNGNENGKISRQNGALYGKGRHHNNMSLLKTVVL